MHRVRAFAWFMLGCGRIGFDDTTDAQPPRALCDRVTDPIYCSDFEGGNLAGATAFGAKKTSGFDGDGFVAVGRIDGGDILRFERAPITSGGLHVGARIFIAPGAVVADYLVLVEAKGPGSEKISMDGSNEDSVQIVSTVGAKATMRTAPMILPRGRWVCVELSIELGAAGDASVRIDDRVVASFRGAETSPPGGITRFNLGAIGSPANTANEQVIVDNWIISRSPIGCP